MDISAITALEQANKLGASAASSGINVKIAHVLEWADKYLAWLRDNSHHGDDDNGYRPESMAGGRTA